MTHLILLLIILPLFSEVLPPLKARHLRQARRPGGTFNPGRRASLRRMLPEWACAQTSAVG